jgi:hypothetical protein
MKTITPMTRLFQEALDQFNDEGKIHVEDLSDKLLLLKVEELTGGGRLAASTDGKWLVISEDAGLTRWTASTTVDGMPVVLARDVDVNAALEAVRSASGVSRVVDIPAGQMMN